MAAKFPTTLGACVDLCYQLRADRLELEAQADKLKERQQELEDHIFQQFKKQEIDGAKGGVATAALTRTMVPTLKDYAAFVKHILKTKQIDLLERRPARAACKARWDAGEKIPGIEPFQKVGLSLTRIGTKE